MKADIGLLIDDLCKDVEPVQRVWSPLVRSAVWIPACCLSIFLGFYFADAFRLSLLQQLSTAPRFFIECVVGIVAGAVAAFAMFESMVPGIRWTTKRKLLVLLPSFLFVALSLFSLVSPAMKPSWAGWRVSCETEILLAGSIPAVLCFILGLRAAPTNGAWTGILAVVASCLPAVVAMNLACMYAPGHILFFHIAPVAMVAVAGGFLGRAVFRV